ncbi:MAG: hypothetical protein IH624_01975 [Phycisphaerae bacterium]|nr:hypothetical protein [Phycisphaerae bacterium]
MNRYGKYAIAAMVLGVFPLSNGVLSAGVMTADRYYTWGIDGPSLEIPEGSIITEAVLTIENIQNWNNNLHIHLVDNPPLDFVANTDTDDGDFFESFGGLLTTGADSLVGGDLVIAFSAVNDENSWAWDVFAAPFQFLLADGSVVAYSSSLLELIDYAGNGTPFGLGFDPHGGNCDYERMTLAVTVTSYEGSVQVYTMTLRPVWSTLSGPVLETNKSLYDCNDNVVVTYSNAAPNGGTWIGLYKKGASDGNYLAWSRTNGTATGSITFAGPTGAGEYEARMFFNNVFDKRAVMSFTVRDPLPALSVAKPVYAASENIVVTYANAAPNRGTWIGLYQQGASDGMYLTWARTDGSANGSISFAGFSRSDSYEARMFFNNVYDKRATVEFAVDGNQAVLNSAKTDYVTGENITLTYADAEANFGVWIALYQKGAADNKYITWCRTNGTATGSVVFPGLTASGTYQARMFFHNVYDKAAEVEFTVGMSAPQLSMSKASYPAGESVVVNYANVECNFAVWIGLYRQGAPDTAYLTWSRTNGTANGSVTFPALNQSGTYEARLFYYNTFAKQAEAQFSVN